MPSTSRSALSRCTSARTSSSDAVAGSEEAFGAIEKTPLEPLSIRAADHKLVRELLDIDQRLSTENLTEAWHDLMQIKEQSQTMFEVGVLPLDVKARLESLYWQTAEKIEQISSTMDPEEVPEDLRSLNNELADQHIARLREKILAGPSCPRAIAPVSGDAGVHEAIVDLLHIVVSES